MPFAISIRRLAATYLVSAYLLTQVTLLRGQEPIESRTDLANPLSERAVFEGERQDADDHLGAFTRATPPEQPLASPRVAAMENGLVEPNHSRLWVAGIIRPLRMQAVAWYRRTPPSDRIAWGGLVACGGLALWVFSERLIRLRARKVIPVDFTSKFINSLHDGKMDCAQALDHSERNPSPASRVALAALRRLGRPTSDLERAVTLAVRVECDRLRRNISTLWRITLLAPLIGLMDTLFALSRSLEAASASLKPGAASTAAGLSSFSLDGGIGATLTPLVVGVVIAILALVAYDGLCSRVEKLSSALERLGAETIDAIALMIPTTAPRSMLATPRNPVIRAEVNHSAGPHKTGQKKSNHSIPDQVDRQPTNKKPSKRRPKPR